jgi:hypothetical protein
MPAEALAGTTVRVRRGRRDDLPRVLALLGRESGPRATRLYRRVVADLGTDLYVAEDAGGEVVGLVSIVYSRSLFRGGLAARLDGHARRRRRCWTGSSRSPSAARAAAAAGGSRPRSTAATRCSTRRSSRAATAARTRWWRTWGHKVEWASRGARRSGGGWWPNGSGSSSRSGRAALTASGSPCSRGSSCSAAPDGSSASATRRRRRSSRRPSASTPHPAPTCACASSRRPGRTRAGTPR